MMRWPKWILSLSCGLVFAVASGLVVLALFYLAPSNSRDNQNPAKQAEMVQITLEWGQLAPFPAKAQNFFIYTEGNSFTRSFRASFNASDKEIENWIAESPGQRVQTTCCRQCRLDCPR